MSSLFTLLYFNIIKHSGGYLVFWQESLAVQCTVFYVLVHITKYPVLSSTQFVYRVVGEVGHVVVGVFLVMITWMSPTEYALTTKNVFGAVPNRKNVFGAVPNRKSLCLRSRKLKQNKNHPFPNTPNLFLEHTMEFLVMEFSVDDLIADLSRDDDTTQCLELTQYAEPTPLCTDLTQSVATTPSQITSFGDVEAKFMQVMQMTMQSSMAMSQALNVVSATQSEHTRSIDGLTRRLDAMQELIHSDRGETLAAATDAVVKASNFKDVDSSLVMWCLLNFTLDTKEGIDFFEFKGQSVLLHTDFLYKTLISTYMFGSSHRLGNVGSGVMKSYRMFRVVLQGLGFSVASSAVSRDVARDGIWMPMMSQHKESTIMAIDVDVFTSMLRLYREQLDSGVARSFNLPTHAKTAAVHTMSLPARILEAARSVKRFKSGGYAKESIDCRVFGEEFGLISFSDELVQFFRNVSDNQAIGVGRHIELGFMESLHIASRKRKRQDIMRFS